MKNSKISNRRVIRVGLERLISADLSIGKFNDMTGHGNARARLQNIPTIRIIEFIFFFSPSFFLSFILYRTARCSNISIRGYRAIGSDREITQESFVKLTVLCSGTKFFEEFISTNTNQSELRLIWLFRKRKNIPTDRCISLADSVFRFNSRRVVE